MATSLRVLLTGGTGLIGRRVVQALVNKGDTCTVVSRRPATPVSDSSVRMVQADPTRPGAWQAEVEVADAVVNLAGARLVEPPKRWTDGRKRLLRASRVETTKRLVEAIAAAGTPPGVFLTGSAIGYYGDRGDELLSEGAEPGTDFLAALCHEWEDAARPATARSRVVWLRTGLVLDAHDGFLAPLLPFFRLGLGAGWAGGRGWLSWIHHADEVGLILAALTDQGYEGPVNCTAPEPATVGAFVQALGAVLRRPTFLNLPAFALGLGLGEAADALLHLQRVRPTRALDLGYEFAFPTLKAALEDLLA